MDRTVEGSMGLGVWNCKARELCDVLGRIASRCD
jgi:hypothetical protein